MCQAWGITSLDHPSPWKLSKRPSLSRGYSYNALNLGNLGHTKVSEGGGNSRKVAPFQSSRFRPPGGGAGYPRGNPRGCLLSPVGEPLFYVEPLIVTLQAGGFILMYAVCVCLLRARAAGMVPSPPAAPRGALGLSAAIPGVSWLNAGLAWAACLWEP